MDGVERSKLNPHGIFWMRCLDCAKGFPRDEYNRHMASHVSRPQEDAMTLAEVAAAVGHTVASIHHRARTGKLKTFMVGDKRPQWVLGSEFKRFVATLLAKDPTIVIRWAKTGDLK